MGDPAELPPGAAPFVAALAHRYRVERELGRGGMATVYLADDVKHGRKVAIKVLRPELAAVIGAERFAREIRTIAALQHPHILGLIDSGEAGGAAYYVMPFVEGETLRARLARERQLSIEDALSIATEVASALDYAHRRGVVHRDVKPENILLLDGEALITDFGIAVDVSPDGSTRMTAAGVSLGTPHYMAPEQAMGEREITPRADVYALGCVMYEMLLGEPPFTGPTAQAIVAKVMTDQPGPIVTRRDTVPPAIERAIHTALRKLPADRFASAAAFSAAMAAGEASVMAHSARAPRQLTPTCFRLSEGTCRRLDRQAFDPRLIGTALQYVDNGVSSDTLVCFIPACGRGADQYTTLLETTAYWAIAPTGRGLEPVATWRPSLSLEDHIVLVRELLRDVVARVRPRFPVIAGFSSGADFSMRFAAAPDPEARVRIDGCLALGSNLSIQTCFLTSALATLESHDDNAMFNALRRVSDLRVSSSG